MSGVAFAVTPDMHLQQARRYHRQGENGLALTAYRVYLQSNNVPEFGSIVIEASRMLSGVTAQRALLNEFMLRAAVNSDRAQILRHIAFLYEYESNLSQAIQLYTAANALLIPRDSGLTLRIAKLQFELGEYLEALQLAESVAAGLDVALQSSRLVVIIRSLLMLPDRRDEVQQILERERVFMEEEASVSLLYLFFLLFQHQQDNLGIAYFRVLIAQRFPNSPEHMLIQGVADRAITPSLLWW